MGGGFVAAVAAAVGDQPAGVVSAHCPAGLCMVVLALATMVRFDTPFGFTVPTQVAFVPLVFAVPPAIVPIAVVVALALGRLRDVLAGEEPAEQAAVHVRQCLVLRSDPRSCSRSRTSNPATPRRDCCCGALAAQFLADFFASALRYAIARGASLSSQLREIAGCI